MSSKCLEKHVLVFVIISTFVVGESMELSKWEINIKNELDLRQELFMHCKSKDTDLGERSLSTNAAFNWNFRVNIWGTTLFWCYLRRPDGADATFDVFWVERKTKWLCIKCDHNICNWVAKYNGIYLMDNSEGTGELIHFWKPGKTNETSKN